MIGDIVGTSRHVLRIKMNIQFSVGNHRKVSRSKSRFQNKSKVPVGKMDII